MYDVCASMKVCVPMCDYASMYLILCVLQGIMLVYDITNEKSFDNIKTWIKNIQEV